MSQSPPLYFWHIPKTAGTSFIAWLDSHFSADEIFPAQLLGGFDAAPPAGFRLYRGHLGSELPYRLGGPLRTATLLREPRARTVSHLGHIWRHPEHPVHGRLRSSRGDLRAALADPAVRLTVADGQSRYLGLDPWSADGDPARLDPPLDVRPDLLAQVRYEFTELPDRQTLVRRAVARLRGMTRFGFAERLDAFAARVATLEGWAPPGPLSRANTAPPDSCPWSLATLTRSEQSLIDELNRADRAVYRWARALQFWALVRRPRTDGLPSVTESRAG